MTTLKDVAREARVSIGTASQALSGTVRVNSKTAEKVREAAAKLGYRYKRYVDNAFVNSESHNFGSVISFYLAIGSMSDPYDFFFSRMVTPVSRIITDAGHSMRVYPEDSADKIVEKIKQSPNRARLDGTLLYILHRLSSDDLTSLIKLRTPVVVIGDHVEGLPYVCIDNRRAARDAVMYLITLGHRRIGYVGATASEMPDKTIDDEARSLGYLDAVTRAGLNCSHTIRQGVESLLTQDEPPTALFTFDDYLAVEVIEMCKNYSLSVPGDISVFGFGNHPEVIRIYPSLSTVNQPVTEHAVTAARMLCDQIGLGRPAEYGITFTCNLMLRGTCAPPQL